MALIKKHKTTIILILLVLAISLFETNSVWVEQYYYLGIYPKISFVQRIITGWVPFSIGDALYLLLLLFITYSIYFFIREVIKKANKIEIIKRSFLKAIHFLLIIYIAFKLLWGLNYSRQGIVKQLDLEETVYCKEELINLIEDLIFEANNCRKQISDTSLSNISINKVFADAKNAYAEISKQYNFLSVNNFSIKPSLFSPTGNYLGYTGYYNPFTGEAQVRDDIPKILLPFIACHEVAHQLGYASEDEANFVAFLVAEKTHNTCLKYSMCLEVLDYALSDLFFKYYEDFDIINFPQKRLQLEDCFDSQVKEDRKAIKYFFKQNRKEISNISSNVYDKYLKINKQNAGIYSYNNIVRLIFRYYLKKC
ncbi:MAG: DUF3810 domain-containing protein [Chitinophagaceae bacterium]